MTSNSTLSMSGSSSSSSSANGGSNNSSSGHSERKDASRSSRSAVGHRVRSQQQLNSSTTTNSNNNTLMNDDRPPRWNVGDRRSLPLPLKSNPSLPLSPASEQLLQEDPSLREKLDFVRGLTQWSSDDDILQALGNCQFNVERAINSILDGECC